MTERHILPIAHPRPLDVLSDEALVAVREATHEVLERTGVEVRSERLLKELDKAGARADLEAGRALLPREVVDEALAGVPRAPTFASREPGLDLVLDGSHGYLAVDGCAAEIADLLTDERRPSTKADVAQVSRIADALPQISFLWQPVSARDVPVHTEPLHNLHAQLANTGKHIQGMSAVTAEQAQGVVEMARIVAGGEEALRERPIVSAFQCSISPLTYDGGPLEAALVFAEAGVPCGFMVMPIACATAPATATGALVISNAEVVAGAVALQLLSPGAKTFYGSCATVMDLRSGAATCGGPEDLLFQMASAQLARSYGLPSAIGTFATGAKLSDWQAGTENGLSGTSSWLAGADMLCGAGLLYGARVYSPTQLLLDAELFDAIAGMARGFGVSDDELAAEVIEEVGPGGHFLAADHTLRHMRELWQSRLFSRESWEEWEAEGRPEPRDRARERARQILAEHRPHPLPDGVDGRLIEVIERHER